jgi:hypothetical protein
MFTKPKTQPEAAEPEESPAPRPGDVVEEHGGYWLVLPDVLGGLRRELLDPASWPGGKVTTSGLQCDSVLGRRFLVTDRGEPDQRAWSLGGWLHAEPPGPFNERATRLSGPWWGSLVPRTRSTASLLDAADASTPPPWASVLRDDPVFLGIRQEMVALQLELAAGIADGVRVNQVRAELIASRKMIESRGTRARVAWVGTNAADPTVDEIEARLSMFRAAWWMSRDGSAGEVELFVRTAWSINRDVAAWRDPGGQSAEMLAWFAEHGVEVPAMPDLPAKPRSIDDVLASRATTAAEVE